MSGAPEESTAAGGSRDTSEDLYDRYLDGLLGGSTEAPEDFLDRHGVRDAELAESLRRLRGEGGGVRAAGAPGPGRVGAFVIERRLGRGGMGEVFLARQESLGRRVALKVIRADYAASEGALTRFAREARAAARLRHPNIVTVLEVGQDGGVRYIAMEYVPGRGLDAVLSEHARRGEPIQPARIARWGQALAGALETAHREGVVHRDIKPSNVLLTEDDRPMLLDFGLARDLREAGATLTEAFVGSPHYAAPEQVGKRGGSIDARTDIYSLGVVLYQCTTGIVPFSGETLEQVLQSILVEEPPDPRRLEHTVPRDLSVIIAKAIQKDPALRYQSAAAFGADLRAFLEYRPIAARPPGPWRRIVQWSRRHRAASAAAATAALALCAVVAAVAWRSASEARARGLEAAATISEARGLVGAYREAGERTRRLEQEYERASEERTAEYFPPERERRMNETEIEVRRARSARDLAVYNVLELTARAERLGGDVAEIDRVRGELYLQRYLEAEVRSDTAAMALYGDLVRAHDTDGSLTGELVGLTGLVIRCAVPGAEAFLFRRAPASTLREGAEPRHVSVPLRGEPPAPLDALVLRVLEDHGPLRAGDVIDRVAGVGVGGALLAATGGGGVEPLDRLVSVDGRAVGSAFELGVLETRRDGPEREYVFDRGGRRVVVSAPSLAEIGVRATEPWRALAAAGGGVRAWTDGGWREVAVPAGIRARPDAAAAYLSSGSRLAGLPEARARAEPGPYLLVVRAPGRELYRTPLTVVRGFDTEVDVRPLASGTTPEGWVYVPPTPPTPRFAPGDNDGYWIMEREVTVGEYFGFLNDPAVLARIDASSERLYHPYGSPDMPERRGAAGELLIPEGWRPDWPMLLVSWHDAAAYAAWRTERERLAGNDVTLALPTRLEWIRACAAPGDYVFGDEFRPKWASSNWARPSPDPEPVMSFPIDQSVLGVFDTAGSASEWTDHLWRPDRSERYHAGGAWGIGEEGYFKVYGGNGLAPELRSGVIGFRLVMRRGGG